MHTALTCPQCGEVVKEYTNPAPTVDVVVYDPVRGLLLIERKNIPHGYALPGGFVDAGESAEAAAVRELKEETHLDVTLRGLLGVYSKPNRDPRRHTLGVVFVGAAHTLDTLHAGDDAKAAAFWRLDALPPTLAFDHAEIVRDFMDVLRGERTLAPIQK